MLNVLTSTIHLSTATSDMTFRNLSALHSQQMISTTKVIIIFTSARQKAGNTNACNGSQHLSNVSQCNYKQKKSAAKHNKANDYRRSPQQIVGIVKYVQHIIITEPNVWLWFSNWSATNQVLSVGEVKGTHHNQSERKTGNHDIYSIEYQNTTVLRTLCVYIQLIDQTQYLIKLWPLCRFSRHTSCAKCLQQTPALPMNYNSS